MKTTRIVFTDAQQAFRHKLSDYLKTIPEIKIVTETSSGKEISHLISTYQPDILLTNRQLPDTDGLTLIREVARRHPAVAMLVLENGTESNTEEEIWAVIQAGAKGYVSKHCSQAILAYYQIEE